MREFGFAWSWCRGPDSVGCALRPTAQSGRGGRGCFDEVDVIVRRDEEEEEDCHNTPRDAHEKRSNEQKRNGSAPRTVSKQAFTDGKWEKWDDKSERHWRIDSLSQMTIRRLAFYCRQFPDSRSMFFDCPYEAPRCLEFGSVQRPCLLRWDLACSSRASDAEVRVLFGYFRYSTRDHYYSVTRYGYDSSCPCRFRCCTVDPGWVEHPDRIAAVAPVWEVVALVD